MATETEERTRLYEERAVPRAGGDSLAARVARALRAGPTEEASPPAKAEGAKAEKPAAKPAEPVALENHRPESPGLTAENLTDFYDRLKEASRAATAPWATRYEEATKEGEATRKSVVLPALEGERAAATVPPPPLPRLAGSPPPPPIQPRRFLDGGSQNAIRAIVNGLGLIAQMFAGAKAPVAALGAVTGAMRGWAEGDDVRADAAWRQYLIEVERIKSDNAQALEMWQAAMQASGMSLDQAKARATVALQEAGLSDHAAEVALRGMEAAGKQFDREASLARGLYDDTIKLMQIQSTDDLKREILRSRSGYEQKRLDIEQQKVDLMKEGAEATPEQVDRYASQVAAGLPVTQVIPGWGRSPLRQKVVDRAIAMLEAKGDGPGALAVARADYDATKGELARTQAQRALVVPYIEAFANTGTDLLLKAAETGALKGPPALNRWIQAGRKATGSADVARLDAAVLTVANEYGRVMGGGTVISDSARTHALDMINSAMTVPQLKAVVTTLKAEIEGRKNEIDQHIEFVRDLMRKRSTGMSGSTEEVVSPDGKFVWRGGTWEPR